MNRIISLSTAALIGIGTIGVAYAQEVDIQSPVGITLQPPFVAHEHRERVYPGYHDPDDVTVVKKRYHYHDPADVTVVRKRYHDYDRNLDYDDRGVIIKKY